MCTNPRRLVTPTGQQLTVPCGKCLSCLKVYQDVWLERLTEESYCWPQVNGEYPIVFFTLTYDDDNIPMNYLVSTDRGVVLFDHKPDQVNEEDCVRAFLPIREINALGENNVKERFNKLSEDFLNSIDLPPIPASITSSESHAGYDLPEEYFPINYNEFTRYYGKCIKFNTVRKSDVQGWLKYCRKVRSRADLPCYFTPPSGIDLPSRFRCKSFRYFITAEYGPRTFRPHYHGVLFGVTVDEFRRLFVPNWRFGKVEFSALDPSKGGILYLSKYCSKGCYGNFFAQRDYIYANSAEYHSRFYEYGIRYFGADAALCDPTFHCISKGIGSAYPFRSGVAEYWKVRLDRLGLSEKSIDYEVTDSFPLPFPSENTINPSKEVVLSCQGTLNQHQIDLFSQYVSNEYIDTLESFDKNSGARYAWSEFELPPDPFLEQRLYLRRYARRYTKREKYIDKDGREKEKLSFCVAEHPLARYYHRYLRTPGQAALVSAASRKSFNSSVEQQARMLLGKGEDFRVYVMDEIARNEVNRAEDSAQRLRRSYSKLYTRLDTQDKIDLCTTLPPLG